MKKAFYQILYAILIVVCLLHSSCTKLCDYGYEGKRCDIPVREKFLGIWAAADNPGNFTYVDTITPGVNLLEVVISNNFALNYFNNPVKATVDADKITIYKQNPDSDSLYVEGTGTITNNNTINWSYTLSDHTDTPIVSIPYTGVWSK